MNIEESSFKPRILVAPLDWGLGHATRSIPLINKLLDFNCTVFLAGEGRVRSLLENEFPTLNFLDLKGYNITYSKNRWTLPFSIGAQIPKILSTIDDEQIWLQNVIKEHGIDAVISDNRYGLYHPAIPSIFITHQLLIKTGFGKFADGLLQQFNYDFINRFTECWIPDEEGDSNLGGDLSHPDEKPEIPLKYLGPLSRFNNLPAESVEETHLLLLISGPEPQRSILEQLLIEQLSDYNDKVVFVRGLPGNTDQLETGDHIEVYDHLPAKELKQKFEQAHLVISRCGYSTVMDLAAMKKKCILIPTPGQTEQEYLATYLMQHNFALCIDQDKFKLTQALNLAASYNYSFPNLDSSNQLTNAIQNLLSSLRSVFIGPPAAGF